jgi:hypothetical protein
VAKNEITATPVPRAVIPQFFGSINSSGGSDSSGDGSGGSGNFISLAVIAGAVGIIGLSLLGIVLIGGFAVWRIFMRQVDDALDPTYYPDDQIRPS